MDETKGDGSKTYTQAISRILKNTFVGEVRLWDIIKPKGEVRRISIADFEKNCFGAWAQYIERNCEQYDAKALEADRERMRVYAEDTYWEEQAAIADEIRNRAYESGYVPGDTAGETGTVPEAEVRRMGLDMMTEAIYSVLFDEFDWDSLRADLETVYKPSEAYGDETSGEEEKAAYRLKSYMNYIGQRKL